MDDQVNIYSVISATASSISSSFDGETTRITSVLDDDEVDSLVATFPPSNIASSTSDSQAPNYCHITSGTVKYPLTDQFTEADLVLLQLDDTDWNTQLLDESDSLLCLDLEPMAALFAFNASCNSPSYSLPHDFKPSPESKFSIHEGLLESLAPTPNSNNLRSGSCSNSCSYTPVQPHSPINHSYGGCPQRPSYQSHQPLQPPQYPTSSISPHVHAPSYHLSPQNSYSPSPNSSSYYGSQPASQMCYGSGGNNSGPHGAASNINCGNNQAATGQGEIISSSNTTSHFPTASVSVNLSMNMTMGFAGHHSDAQQMVQWSIPPQSQYSNNSPATNNPVNCTATTTAYQIHQFAAQQSNSDGSQSGSFHHPVSMSENILTGRQMDHSVLLDKEYHHHSYHHQQQQQSQSIVTPVTNGNGRDSGPPATSIGSTAVAIRSAAIHSSSQVSNSDRMANSQENSHKVYLRSVECSESRIESQVAQNTKQLVESNSCKGDMNIGLANLCRICGKTYARPSTLKTHLRTHSGERPYRCEYCDKSFSQAANLTAHIRTHSGEKPFRCLVCDRQFSQSSSVTTHMRTHSGERPYRCRMCKKAFSDSSTLTKHLRIHSGEKFLQVEKGKEQATKTTTTTTTSNSHKANVLN